MSRVVPWLGATAFCAVLAITWSFPLVCHIDTSVPGDGPGDNLAFLWSLWWMRYSLASPDLDFFRTTYLYFPAGVDLTLHTHTALNAWAAATLLSPLASVTAQNIVILVSLFLNAAGAYALAMDVAGHKRGALLAAVTFGGAPFIMGHLQGHFNLVAAWGIPFFILFLTRSLRRRSAGYAIAGGLLLTLVSYVDYYYLVFLVLSAVLYAASRWITANVLTRHVATPALTMICGALIVLDWLVIAIILLSGGVVVHAGPFTLFMRSTLNPLTFSWIVGLAWVILRWRPTVRVRFAARRRAGRDLRYLSALALVFMLGSSPLIWSGWALWGRGEYVSQDYVWRNAPQGIDVATLFAGNYWHPVWGGATRFLYHRLRIDPIERAAWLGVVAPLTIVFGWTRVRHLPHARAWLGIGIFFVVWSLGPYLTVCGVNSGLILPQTLVRFVPVLANARIPGRGLVMVLLAMAILCALILSRQTGRRAEPAVQWALIVMTLLDFLAAPFPLYTPDRPAVYEQLGRQPPAGGVLELPFGFADGFGQHGELDYRVLFYQSIHQKPILGGFVARVPDPAKRQYLDNVVLGMLLKLSSRDSRTAPLARLEPRQIAACLSQVRVSWVVLNRRTASPELQRYVDQVMPLAPIAQDGERVLYRLVK